MDTTTYRDIDMTEVCRILQDEHGIDAYVAMTGGGVATIYAGTAFPHPDGGLAYPALAGPGTFRFDGSHEASTEEFYIGHDQSLDEDAEHCEPNPDDTEHDIAARIATYVASYGA